MPRAENDDEDLVDFDRAGSGGAPLRDELARPRLPGADSLTAMAVEIERKFLVAGDDWRAQVRSSQSLRQGYLGEGGKAAVRVRVAGDTAMLTIKSAQAGMTRAEYEYPLPLADAGELLDTLCGQVISKVRYIVPHAGRIWEVDVFEGDNAGLVLAEIELPDEASEFDRPGWLGIEVTDDRRYSNHALSMAPWREWGAPGAS